MKRLHAIIMICLTAGMLANPGTALAHGTEHHGADDALMTKLHGMMPLFAAASARLEAALDRGDAGVVAAEAATILQAVPDLKKTKPHKKVTRRNEYVALATELETGLKATVDRAGKGDFPGAKAAFGKVRETCTACHAAFRD